MKPNKIYKRSLILAMALGLVLTLAAAWPCTAAVFSEPYAILHAFTYPPSNPDGGLIQGNDGNFYGTTQQGGIPGQGTVFKMDPSGTVTILHSFIGLDGGSPQAALIQGSDGNLYGTTYQGGAWGAGTVFKLASDGSGFSTLHAFLGGGDGTNPQAALIQGSDGNLYGTTYQGGASGVGTVFKLAPDGSNFSTLHAFLGGYYGTSPRAALIQGSDGNLYGTTYGIRSWDGGTVFKLTPDGTLTTIRRFTSGNGGSNPWAGLVQDSDGNLYGNHVRGRLRHRHRLQARPERDGFLLLHAPCVRQQ